VPPPPPEPIRWRDFKRFVTNLDRVREYYDGLRDCLHSPQAEAEDGSCYTIAGLEDDAEWLEKLLAKCRAGFERFDCADHYEKPDGDDDDDEVLARDYIANRISVLIGSFPHAGPPSPDVYLRMMVEHLSAVDGLTQVALESACREIVETLKYTPTASEMMSIIEKHVDRWQMRRWAMQNVERMRHDLIAALQKREMKAQQEARERAFQQAIDAARSAMRVTQELAKQIKAKQRAIENETQALAQLCEAHAAAEQHESELLRNMRKLMMTDEERAAEAARKLDGYGCGDLGLTVH
jgi:DNA repair exonuclease SbcCD ATPase subunit